MEEDRQGWIPEVAGETAMRDDGKVRTFHTGATRDTSMDKLEPYGFISPIVMYRFSQYMHKHRLQKDGTMRSSDNWQKGIPVSVYIHSLIRHVLDLWMVVSGHSARFDPDVQNVEEIACAILFNVQGLLHELIQGRDLDEAIEKARAIIAEK